MNQITSILKSNNASEIIQYGLTHIKNYKLINQIICHCTNQKIDVIELIQKYLLIDPLSIPIKANYALQLLQKGRQEVFIAYPIILDLIGLEHQNVKTLMKHICYNFKKFSILTSQQQCHLLYEIGSNYQIDIHPVDQLFELDYIPEMEQLKEIKQIDHNINEYIRYKLIFKTGILDDNVPQINYLYKLTKLKEIDIEQPQKLDAQINIIAIQLFNEFQNHEIHDRCFKLYSKKQTLQYISSNNIPYINQNDLLHMEIEFKLYDQIQIERKESNFMNSLSIIILNMQILYKLNNNNEYPIKIRKLQLKNDPQLCVSYIFTLGTLLLQQKYQELSFELFQQLNLLNLLNQEIKSLKFDVDTLINLGQYPQQSIVLEILEKLDKSLYYKYSLLCGIKTLNISDQTNKQRVKTLIQYVLQKQSNEILLQHIDTIYEIICHQKSKNPQRSICNFLEFIYLLSFYYDHSILLSKLQEYFQTRSENLYLVLLQLYQSLEQQIQSLSVQYIAVISKIIYLNSIVAQKTINQKDISFHYYSQVMKYIQHFLNKIPQIEIKKIKEFQVISIKSEIKQKTTLINLTIIERFCRLHKIQFDKILGLKLNLLKDIPLVILYDLSTNEQEFLWLKQLYQQQLKEIKELKFITKLSSQKYYHTQFKLKEMQTKPTLSNFLKHAHKLLQFKSNRKQCITSINQITKLQIYEQLFSELTASLFSYQNQPKYTDQLYKEAEINLFKIEHRELVAFYTDKKIQFNHQLFYNQRADTLQLFIQLTVGLIKILSQLGFYKCITRIIENIELFLYRVLDIRSIIKVYKYIPWYLESNQWQFFIDEICTLVKGLNENRRLSFGEQQSEYTRQSLYRSRKSYVSKMKDTHCKLMQIFQNNNILIGSFSKQLSIFVIEYLCVHNHSQTYLYEKLKINHHNKISIQIRCQVIKNLLECSNPMKYQYQVDETSIHNVHQDNNQKFKHLINQIIPVLVLGGCNLEQPNQNCINYMYQLKLLVQSILSTTLIENIQQSKLYFYLLLRIDEFLIDTIKPEFGLKRCNCQIPQQKYDQEKYNFDLITSIATFQMTMKRFYRQQEKFNIFTCQEIDKQIQLISIEDIVIQRDIITINLFEYNGEKIIIISKYDCLTNKCITKSIKSISKCLQFKDALIYYLKIIQENIDCMNDQSVSKSQWWQKRDYYEKQLIKRQTTIEDSLSSQIDFIFNSYKPILLLSPQLQLLPWDHIRNTIFNRALSLGHIVDLLNLQINPKQDLFYILNPDNDLHKTEKTLLPLLQSYNFRGLIREKPSSDLIIDLLCRKEYYMYIGHGGGEQYYSEKQILSTHKYFNGRPYLLGCSSAQMMELSRFKINNVSQQEIFLNFIDWHGLAVSYLLRGCPTLFGALWPITDKDADKYAIDLIHQYASTQCLNPTKIIQETKPKCTLKQFNGTAFVIYGITE